LPNIEYKRPTPEREVSRFDFVAFFPKLAGTKKQAHLLQEGAALDVVRGEAK
jgi:hypothetical protein